MKTECTRRAKSERWVAGEARVRAKEGENRKVEGEMRGRAEMTGAGKAAVKEVECTMRNPETDQSVRGRRKRTNLISK